MTLHELIDPAVCGRLCLTLLHSLWITPLLALTAWAAGRGSLKRSYAAHTLALAVTLLALPTTYALVDAPESLLPQTGTEANTSPPPTSVQTHDAQPLTELPAAAGSSFAEARQVPPAPVPIDAVLFESTSVPASADSPAAWVHWVPWATGLYLLGVLAMLLRLVAALWHASRLAQTGETLTDPAIFNIATKLCHQWSMKVQPALRQVEHLVVPKVVGLVRPTILLPAAALTGLTASELEMILAHELAHVRRHDMWVNLVQRLAEAVLFFNPALWLLSRRISILREYCCDELACEAMSQSSSATRLRYAEALLHVVELSGNAEHRCGLAASAATGRSPSELRRRVARLFGEPVREPLRITRGGFVAVALTAVLLLAGPAVWTTRAADEPATEVETNATNNAFDEAFEKATKARTSGPATITGRIVLEDGSPATAEGWLYSDSTVETNGSTSSRSSTEGSYTDSFHIEVPAGTVWLSYFPKGFAPTWAGPLELQPGQHRDDITLTLKPGFSELVRVTNEKGEPVAGATLYVHPEINGSAGGPIHKHTTDEKGELLLTHLADTRYSLNITAPGYEPLRTQPLRVEAGETLRPTLTRSQPGVGIVRFADGTPAPNTKLRAISEFSQGGKNRHFGNAGEGFWGSPWAETDSSGRFELDQLTSGSSYLFVVEAVDNNRLIVRDLAAGQEGVQIVLPQRRDLVIKVNGDLSKLNTGRDQPFVAVRQPIQVPRPTGGTFGDLVGGDVTIEPIDGDPKQGGMAIFRGLAIEQNPESPPQQVTVTLGYDHTTKQTIDLKPRGNVVEFDLDEAEPTFESAEANSVQRDGGSAIWFQSDEHMHFAVYYPGFFQRGLQYKQYFTLEHTTSLWRFNGSLNLREPGGEAFARQVPIDFDYRVPDLLLKIDGKEHDLAKGRVFVLDEAGGVKQLPIQQVEPGAMNSEESLAKLREQMESQASKSPADEAIPALQVIGDRFALCPVTTDLQRRLLDGVGGQADSATACLLVNAAAFETLEEIDGDAKGVAQLELFLSEHARRDGRELRIRIIDHGRGNVPFDRQQRMKRLDSLLRKLCTDVGFANVAVTNTFGVSGGGTPFDWGTYIAQSQQATEDRNAADEAVMHLGSLRIMPVSTFLSHRLSNSDCIVDVVPVVRDADGTRFTEDILPMVSRAMEVTPLAGGENLLVRLRYSKTQKEAIEAWIEDIPGRKAYAKQLGFEFCNVNMSQIAEQDERVEPDASRRAPSLVVKLQDENGKPIAGGKVLVYDGNNFWAGQPVKFKQESASTNDKGVATFDQIASRIPRGNSCRVQVQSLDGAAWKPRHVTLGVHRGTRAGSDPLINLETDDSNNRVVTFTLRKHCPLDLEIVDSATGKPIHFAQLLFNDDRVPDWTLAALQDYAGDNDDPTRLGLDFSTTLIPEMSDAKFMATCEGYYPHEFTLDEQLSPDKTLTKRIELKPAPTIQAAVFQPGGKPAVGAKFRYVGPKRRGSYFPIQATDAEGRTTIQFPELGELARWRVAHATGETEVEARWYLRDHVEGEPIEAKIRLADDTFSIHGKVTDPAGNPLADVRVRSATGIGTLMGGGRTTTNSDGRYKLRFGRGMTIMEDYAPLGVGVQAAQFYAEKSGWQLQVDEGHIFYLMTDQTPEQFAKLLAEEGGEYWGKSSDDEVVYPNAPREVNFVLEREGEKEKAETEATPTKPAAETNAGGNAQAEGGTNSDLAVGVVDGETGEPVAGAQLYLFQYNGERYEHFGPYTSDQSGQVICDEPVFSNESGKYDRWVYARVPGELVGVTRSASWSGQDAINPNLHVKLYPSTSVEGNVTVPEGFDPTQVKVNAISMCVQYGDEFMDFESFPREERFTGMDTALPQIFEATPDADGNVRFDDIPKRGRLYLRTKAEGLAEAQWWNEAEPLGEAFELNAVKHGVLTGMVLSPDGEPIAGVKLSARLSPKRPARSVGYLSTFNSVTNESGEFNLNGLPENYFVLSATDPQQRWVFRPQEDIHIESGEEEDLTVIMRKSVTVSGKVVDPDGNSIEGAAISALTDTQNDVALDSDVSNVEGRYQLRLPSGAVRLYFNAIPRGFEYPDPQIVKELEIEAGQQVIENLDLVLLRKQANLELPTTSTEE